MKAASLLVLILTFLLRLAGCTDVGTTVTLRLSLDYEGAEAAGRIHPAEDRGELAAEALDVIEKRLERYGLRHRLRRLGETFFEVDFPKLSEEHLDSVTEVVTAAGDLQFRIVVRPREAYAPLPDAETAPRLREAATSPWPESAEAYDAFKNAEVKRWQAARDADEIYVPSRPWFQLYLRTGHDGTEPEHFELVELPDDERFRFGGGSLRNAVTAPDEAGRPAVYYEVKPECQEAFGAWTAQNVGLPVAILFNDRLYADPVIMARMTDRIRLTLGSERSYAETRAEAEQLVSILQAGELRVRPVLVSISRSGK